MKKFKSILGGILSLTMLFTLCTPVYASEETLQPEQQEGTDNTDLDYYKQFIPEGATIVGDVETDTIYINSITGQQVDSLLSPMAVTDALFEVEVAFVIYRSGAGAGAVVTARAKDLRVQLNRISGVITFESTTSGAMAAGEYRTDAFPAIFVIYGGTDNLGHFPSGTTIRSTHRSYISCLNGSILNGGYVTKTAYKTI